MKILPLLALLVLSACSALPVDRTPAQRPASVQELPPMKTFSSRSFPRAVQRSNVDIARDFLDLAFEMESGRTLPVMSRFEGPITIAFEVDGPAVFRADLTDLLRRLRNEAGINITQTTTGAPANIVIATLPRSELQSAVPSAACFVVPRVSSWKEFKQNRRTGALDWSTLKTRQRATIFIPNDVSPQEARDCLHEEVAQSLGPLNDIYRLSDSVFNDDNFHTVLTSFDMLVLRMYYSDALRSGMTRGQATRIVPGLLAQMNPSGRAIPANNLPKTPRAWIDAIESGLGPKSGASRKIAAAQKALVIANNAGWNDVRLGFNHFAVGRLSLRHDGKLAAQSFGRSLSIFVKLYGVDDIHSAYVALQLAAFSLSSNEPEAALKLINPSIPSVIRSQNAALLSNLLLIKAEALDSLGRPDEANTVRLDGLAWARYGFKSDREVRLRFAEIAALRRDRPES